MRAQRYGKASAIIYRWLIDPLVQPLRPKITSLCRKHGVRQVLDIGCATGAQCRALGAAGIHAVGLDLSSVMIASARERSGDHVEYVVGSAYELPFPDRTFDGVLLSLALHEHSEEERSQMLEEALRVIEPDGHLVLAEYSEPAKPRFHLPWAVIRFVEHIAGEEHRTGFRQFMATGGLHGLLRRHGFQSIEIAHSHFHTLAVAVVETSIQPGSSTSEGRT